MRGNHFNREDSSICISVPLFYLHGRYKEVLLMLLTELLKKMQFRHNESQLQELDDESVDDDVCKLFNCEYC